MLVSAAMDAMINAGPCRRAQKAANEMAEEVSLEALNASLTAHLKRAIPGNEPDVAAAGLPAPEGAVIEVAAVAPETIATPAPAPTGVSYSEVRSEQRLMARDHIEDAVLISVRYTLSEDSSTLRIIGTASYQNAQTPYSTHTRSAGLWPAANGRARPIATPSLTILRSSRWRHSLQNSVNVSLFPLKTARAMKRVLCQPRAQMNSAPWNANLKMHAMIA